jgi:hypothetical protein
VPERADTHAPDQKSFPGNVSRISGTGSQLKTVLHPEAEVYLIATVRVRDFNAIYFVQQQVSFFLAVSLGGCLGSKGENE